MTKEDELRAAGVNVRKELTQSQSMLQVLKTAGYTFRMNLCDDSIEVGPSGIVLTDPLAATIRRDGRDRGIKSMEAMQDAYVAEARTNAYHPIKDYFNSLAGQWDKQNRLYEFAQKFKGDSGIVQYNDGRVQPVHVVYFVRWCLGVVAKALDEKQNPMLVWDSRQGLGKSLAARYLCPNDAWFIEGAINTQDKDCEARLMTKLIWEVSELDATTRKADVSALKAFITRGKVTTRKAYGRHDVTKPALCSMIGTINNPSTGFLADETGSRRFMICRLTEIDWTYRAIDVHQLWAQVYHMYREEGWASELEPEEAAVQNTINKRYEIESPITDWIREYFSFTEDEDDTLSIGEIISHLAEKGHRLSGAERAQAMEVGRVLTTLNLTKKHTGTGNRWVGIAIKH